MTDKEAYNDAVRQADELRAFLDKPRCVTCQHYQSGGHGAACVMHGAIPEEYLFTPNECGDYEIDIPF